MGSRYVSSSTSHNYQPVSPPWSQRSSSQSGYHHSPTRAPAMPYTPLPTVDYTPYMPMPPHCKLAPPLLLIAHPVANTFADGPITPPPTPSEMHPALTARPTIVRYDFAHEPATLRMSSSAPSPSFPGGESAVRPGATVMYVECEASGQTITIRPSSSSRNLITCSDVLTQLHQYFSQPLHHDDWQRVQDPQQRRAMKAAFNRRTEYSRDQRPCMRLVDYLEGQTVFKRLIPQRGNLSRSTWTLQTTS